MGKKKMQEVVSPVGVDGEDNVKTEAMQAADLVAQPKLDINNPDHGNLSYEELPIE